MMISVPSWLLVVLFSLTFLTKEYVDAYRKSDFVEDRENAEQEFEVSSFLNQLAERNDLTPWRDEALQKIQKILGIRSQSENLTHRKVPPQFMMELYNTIADPSGVARGRNPYNAKVVRSFIERDNDALDTSISHFYFFNISGLEINESVLEAELHLYRKKLPIRNVYPLMLTSPYYLIRIYQVLNDRSLDVPNLHRLLNVRYVGAHASGWQVFNVKQAVLGWVSGEPNLGFLVTASNLFEDQEVSVEFYRRNNYHHSKQPILVLFDDDSSENNNRFSIGETSGNIAPRYYTYGNQDDDEKDQEEKFIYEKNARSGKIDLENGNNNEEHYRRYKKQRKDGDQSEEVLLVDRQEPELFQRQKRRREEDIVSLYDNPRSGSLTSKATTRRRRRNTATSSRKRAARVMSDNRTRFTRISTSMDIYERAMYRERLGLPARDRASARRSIMQQRQLTKRSTSNLTAPLVIQQNATRITECTKHELYVDFRDIGLSSSIIAPPGYSAYQCKGVCEPPLRQDQRPTNHATIQAIVHKMGLVKDVERPCCVPTKLLSTSILFYDDNENVVLKMYEDMIADNCGCR